jgi:hypothetical protein
MFEEALDEAESITRVRAGERVKSALPVNVSISLSDNNRGFEPWVVNVAATEYTQEYRNWAWSPLHQAASSPLGKLGVETTMVVVGAYCPGLISGFYHVHGNEKLQLWALSHGDGIANYLGREIAKIEAEVKERDLVTVPGTPVLNEEQRDQIWTHMGLHLEDLKKLKEKVQRGKLVPKEEG